MRLETIPQGDGVKVVIGTRTYLGPDWIHVDIDPRPLHDPKTGQRHPVDVVCDARKLNLPDNYADIVFNSEVIEHFPYKETGEVIKEWARVVKPGGALITEAPDFLLACNQILEWDCLEGDLRMQQIFFAEQLNPFDFHFAGLTHRTLSHFMEEAGLTVEEVKRGDEWGWLYCRGRK